MEVFKNIFSLFKDRDYISFLEELRFRIIYFAFFLIFFSIISYIYSDILLQFLIYPIKHLDFLLIHTKIYDKFLAYIKLSTYFGFIFSFPILVYQIIRFIWPALYFEEKKKFSLILLFITLNFFLMAIVVYYYLIPLSFQFLLNFNNESILFKVDINNSNIHSFLNVSEYFDFFFFFIIASTIFLELPLILILLNYLNLISFDRIKILKPYIISFIFIVSAIITPPDLLSLLILGIPSYLLFELSFQIMKYISNKRKQKEKNV